MAQYTEWPEDSDREYAEWEEEQWRNSRRAILNERDGIIIQRVETLKTRRNRTEHPDWFSWIPSAEVLAEINQRDDERYQQAVDFWMRCHGGLLERYELETLPSFEDVIAERLNREPGI